MFKRFMSAVSALALTASPPPLPILEVGHCLGTLGSILTPLGK